MGAYPLPLLAAPLELELEGGGGGPALLLLLLLELEAGLEGGAAGGLMPLLRDPPLLLPAPDLPPTLRF